jgi:hypothetical protein
VTQIHESSSELSNDHPENYPRRPIVSSDSEQSLFPEEPDSLSSDASVDNAEGKISVKIDPPFIYKGEIQARLFKKWVRETRLYLTYSGLNRSQSVDIVGKYLAKRGI